MAKPLNARVKIIRGPRPGFEEETVELIIDESELLPDDVILEYILEEN